MDSRLTEPEVDAALQLIQLSGDSADSKVGTGTAKHHAGGGEESVGDSGAGVSSIATDEMSSTLPVKDSSFVVAQKLEESCGLRKRKRKFRSIADIYLKTQRITSQNYGKNSCRIRN